MKRITLTCAITTFCAAAVLVASMPGVAVAASSATRTLNSVKTISLSGGQTEIDLQLSSAAPQPISFSVNDPAMIVMDLDGTASALSEASRSVNTGGITR